ncbi:site-specific integrase [Dyadobacter chenhuakuii]|uniref:Site-specific integrase n=1 Tax=Dyadobacter chenhuakuii TaxID=2909339 RepID=A0ABY4XHF8_9BACT|nr:site-specific integrase [Dyadobacter chenhuakuii]MCF2495779.1 site-specific integrase [Dyadobacter chenhuakuii]USJ29810.1 site-specific integrase [Dyadobacter chenhuakuii]
MARKTTSQITYILHDPKAKAETPIYGIIRFNNDRIKVSTGFKVLPEHWDGAKYDKAGKLVSQGRQRVKNVLSASNKDQVNKYLSDMEHEVSRLLNEMKSERVAVTKEAVKQAIDDWKNPKEVETDTVPKLYRFIQEFIDKSPERTNSKGTKITHRTIQKYNTVFSVLKEFASGYDRVVDFSTIDIVFYTDFKQYLEQKEFSVNNIGKYIQTLKVWLNDALTYGKSDNKAHQSLKFKVTNEESDSIYLSEKELQDIAKIDLSNNKRLEQVRDLFLVGCYTGLRFSDLTTLKSSQIKNGFIRIEQNKTLGKVVIPCFPIVEEMFKKYDGNLPCAISNQKMNDYIKEVCKLAKWETLESISITKGGKRITKTVPKWELVKTHTARRSFATNMYLRGIPAKTIMAVTGHATEKSFNKYIKVTQEEHAILMKKQFDRGVFREAM